MGLARKACKSCAIAKRPCGKQTPQCLRCRKRGIPCTYPPLRHTPFVLLEEETTTTVSSLQIQAPPPPFTPFPNLLTDLSSLPPITSNPFVTSWFASPSTWTVTPPPPYQASATSQRIHRSIRVIRSWLEEWIHQGSNQFIHPQLYYADDNPGPTTTTPRCIQDAYSTLSSYLNKNARNQNFILRILHDRALGLLGDEEDKGKDDSRTSSHSSSSSAHHAIARTQSLLIYTFLSLYDGDVRLRYLAETRLGPILAEWAAEAVERARSSAWAGGESSSSDDGDDDGNSGGNVVNLNFMSSCFSSSPLWRTYILAEAARRTWILVSGTRGLYEILQKGGVTVSATDGEEEGGGEEGIVVNGRGSSTTGILPSCAGGLPFTTRHGVWEAGSAEEWERICCEKNVGFVQVRDATTIFDHFGPKEVGRFARLVLSVSFGWEGSGGVGSD